MASSSIHRSEYTAFIEMLEKLRKKNGITQVQIAGRIGKNQSHVQKTLAAERRLDIVEAGLWIEALETTWPEIQKMVTAALKHQRKA